VAYPKCPKCGSGNIIGYMGEWECMDCGYKFRISPERPSVSAPAKPVSTSTRREIVYPTSTTRAGNGRGKWIAVTILVLIIGLILGYGGSYIAAPAQTIIETVHTTVIAPTTIKETFTLTETLPPSTVTKYITETMSTTITITTIPSPPPGCEIISGEVTTRYDTAHLYVKFKTPVSAIIKLIGPDGEEKSVDFISPDETAVYLQMSPYGETPKPGKYRVMIDSLFGKLAEAEFEFKGYDVTAVRMEFEKTWYEYIGGSLTKIIVHLKNSGDLPTYVIKARVTINRDSKTVDIFRELILPGESSVEIPIYVSLLSVGSHSVKVTLINDEGKEVATAEGTVIFP